MAPDLNGPIHFLGRPALKAGWRQRHLSEETTFGRFARPGGGGLTEHAGTGRTTRGYRAGDDAHFDRGSAQRTRPIDMDTIDARILREDARVDCLDDAPPGLHESIPGVRLGDGCAFELVRMVVELARIADSDAGPGRRERKGLLGIAEGLKDSNSGFATEDRTHHQLPRVSVLPRSIPQPWLL